MGYFDQYKEAVKTKTGRKLTAKYIEWKDKGQQVVGKLLTKNEVSSSLGTGTYNQYMFDSDDGLVKVALGKAADGEAGALMVVGGVYAITFQGQEKLTGGRKINRFDVMELEAPVGSAVGGAGDIPF